MYKGWNRSSQVQKYGILVFMKFYWHISLLLNFLNKSKNKNKNRPSSYFFLKRR